MPKTAEDYEDRYTDPELRERLKEEIKASDKGGRRGQWSARKSQLLVQAYEREGGGYKGEGRSAEQRHLHAWTEEEWQTQDGGARARDGETTRRYLPKDAWEKLSPQERKATERRKRGATGQHAPNTAKAKQARRQAGLDRLDELTVPEVLERAGRLDRAALRRLIAREGKGKGRKTLLARLERELG